MLDLLFRSTCFGLLGGFGRLKYVEWGSKNRGKWLREYF